MISQDDLARIDGLLAEPAAGNPLGDFRKNFPGLSLTRCDAQDMSGEPAFREYTKYNLYLVDGRDHCWRITDDPGSATGIVLAVRN
ncbi:MAG: hypothetical protein AB1591_02860 [Pseudomonadota bacterium]